MAPVEVRLVALTGMELTGKPIGTIVRGQVAMWEDQLADAPTGRPIRFEAVDFG